MWCRSSQETCVAAVDEEKGKVIEGEVREVTGARSWRTWWTLESTSDSTD